MRFSNKTLSIFIITVGCILFLSINVIPNLVLLSTRNNLENVIQKYSRIESNDLNIKGMDVITRSDKIFYVPDGPVPTNKVWSSVVFKGQISGLYTYPFASNTAEGSLNVTIPKKNVYPKLIAAQLISEYLSIKGSDDVSQVNVESYSDISVNLNFFNKFGNTIFTATYIQGSPYIYILPKQNTIRLSSDFFEIGRNGSEYIYTYEDKKLGVFTNGDINQEGNSLTLSFSNPESGYLTVAAFEESNYEVIKNFSSNIINNASSSFDIKDNKVNVTYNFEFKDSNKKNTVFGLLPHQYLNGGYSLNNKLFTINTLRGDQHFFTLENSITYSIQRVPLAENFKFETFTEEDKKYIASLIERDLKDIVYIRSSTYFGGNDILKLANLLQVSNQIGNNDLASRIKTRLNQEFDEWFNYKSDESSKYFAFDEAWGGIIGYETSGFGGENYNDHHFQYGYFIHAASILAKYDSTFVERYGYFIDNLVLDIANINKENQTFPYLRYFDQYEGHSWATGLGDFTDGNNQESSSEAINAWYSVWLWSKVTSNNDLNKFAEYLYSSEVNSTRNYWLNWYNNASIFPDGYEPNKASTVWGGKVEYQTFFSLEPQSIEGIQYLPFSPGSIYLYNPSILQRDYNYFKNNLSDLNAHLIDMNYFYYAIYKGAEILPKGLIENMKIDEGNSRAYMYYWTKFWDRIASVESILDNGVTKYRLNFKNGTQTIL